MTRYNILLFSIVILGFSLYGLLTGSYYTNLLIDTSVPFVAARVVLVTALLVYTFVPRSRRYASRGLLGVTAVSMIVIGCMSLGSATLLRLVDAYILPGDSLTLIEAGILALIAAVELPIVRAPDMGQAFGGQRPLFTGPARDMDFIKTSRRTLRRTRLSQQIQKHGTVTRDTSADRGYDVSGKGQRAA